MSDREELPRHRIGPEDDAAEAQGSTGVVDIEPLIAHDLSDNLFDNSRLLGMATVEVAVLSVRGELQVH